MDASNASELYSVTELAADLGVTARTLRFYEDKGLIEPRRIGNTRVYTHRDRGRLILILRGKRLGFSLREIREWLELYEAGPGQRKQMEALLETAVLHVREVTGFDRVMAYRFRHDGSGDVVAESVREDWAPFLGMRYPASDIPAQARRLYTINTLRLIADINSKPVPLFAR